MRTLFSRYQHRLADMAVFPGKPVLAGMLFMAAGISPAAHAIVFNVSTEFRPSVDQPLKNEFTNKTPLSGFCSDTTSCKEGEFSVLLPAITANKYLDPHSADMQKNHVSIDIDGSPRNVTLTDPKTGNTINAVFRVALFGMTHTKRDTSSPGALFDLMNQTGLYPSGGCSGRTGYGQGGGSGYMHGWGIPERKVSCYRKLHTSYEGRETYATDVNISGFSVGYTLVTPEPLKVLSGDYEGELVYTLGDGGDIDLHASNTSESEIRIRITALVRHEFSYRFPAGSENVHLEPPEGWGPWVNGGQIPHSLIKEVPFTLTSTVGFSVRMNCQYAQGQGCGIKNSASGETVPVDVLLTLPGFRRNGADISNMLLTTSGPQQIESPGSYVFEKRSRLDFRVNPQGVETMVKAGPSTWRGIVTLIFDADT